MDLEVNLAKVKERYAKIVNEEDELERARLLQHFYEDGMLSYLLGIAIAVESNRSDELDLDASGFSMHAPSEESMFWTKKKFTFDYKDGTYTFELCPEDASGKHDAEFTHFISGPYIEEEGHEYVVAMITEGDSEFEALFSFGVPVEGTNNGTEVMYTTLERNDFTDFLAMLYATANQKLG